MIINSWVANPDKKSAVSASSKSMSSVSEYMGFLCSRENYSALVAFMKNYERNKIIGV